MSDQRWYELRLGWWFKRKADGKRFVVKHLGSTTEKRKWLEAEDGEQFEIPPWNMETKMGGNREVYRLFEPEVENVTRPKWW